MGGEQLVDKQCCEGALSLQRCFDPIPFVYSSLKCAIGTFKSAKKAPMPLYIINYNCTATWAV